jgi:hypothetical protein
MTLPEIRIQYGQLLAENASQHLNKLWGNGRKMTTDMEMEKIVQSYKKAWKPYEQKVLTGITSLTGLQFRQNSIDVYIAPWFNAFSSPLVIGITHEPDQFIDTLTHELIHRLLTDNTAVPYDALLADNWKKLYGTEHNFGTLIHIPVHAILEAVYMDVLDEPKRVLRDKQNSKEFTRDYADAWAYVETHGYKEIIDKLRKDYSL